MYMPVFVFVLMGHLWSPLHNFPLSQGLLIGMQLTAAIVACR